MTVQVRIPAVLRKHVDGQRSIDVESGDLRDVLGNLVSKHPSISSELFDGESLHRFINIYLNDEDVRYLDGLGTKVADGDVVAILPAVAGGSHRCVSTT